MAYDDQGNIIGIDYNGVRYYYITDALSNVIKLINTSGTVVVTYNYNSWGKVLSTTGSLASSVGANNPFRYRSYYYDIDIGMYYLISRYYDPNTGRFISPDSILSDSSLFAYCGNDPINGYDPTGKFVLTLTLTSALLYFGIAACSTVLVVGAWEIGTEIGKDIANERAKDKIKDWVITTPDLNETQNHSVYYLYDKDDASMTPLYIGRTNNPTRRLKEHQNTPGRENWKMKVVATNLSKNEARFTEQLLIATYTVKALKNERNEIAPLKWATADWNNATSTARRLIQSVNEDELYHLRGGS